MGGEICMVEKYKLLVNIKEIVILHNKKTYNK